MNTTTNDRYLNILKDFVILNSQKSSLSSRMLEQKAFGSVKMSDSLKSGKNVIVAAKACRQNVLKILWEYIFYDMLWYALLSCLRNSIIRRIRKLFLKKFWNLLHTLSTRFFCHSPYAMPQRNALAMCWCKFHLKAIVHIWLGTISRMSYWLNGILTKPISGFAFDESAHVW